MNKKEPFSRGTIAGAVLSIIPSKVRNSIMDISGIHDLANCINEGIDQTLNGRRKNVTETSKELDTNEAKINSILKLNHPRRQQFYDFVTFNEENKEWYLNNIDNIKLVEDGIEILGDVFCLEDECISSEISGTCIWVYTYFSHNAAKKHVLEEGKKLPSDWSKYIDFLPGNKENKLNFLMKVLGLYFCGDYPRRGRNYNMKNSAFYWSSTTDCVSTLGKNLIKVF